MVETGDVFRLQEGTNTIGRGKSVDVRLDHPSVSQLHAEVVVRGAIVYVSDLGLSATGTRVGGQQIGRRVLNNGDVVAFGTCRTRVEGITGDAVDDAVELRRLSAPHLTRHEVEVLAALCAPALPSDAVVVTASAHDIASELLMTDAAVKQCLLRLYQKFRIAEGADRRARLANEAISSGVVRLLDSSLRAPGEAELEIVALAM